MSHARVVVVLAAAAIFVAAAPPHTRSCPSGTLPAPRPLICVSTATITRGAGETSGAASARTVRFLMEPLTTARTAIPRRLHTAAVRDTRTAENRLLRALLSGRLPSSLAVAFDRSRPSNARTAGTPATGNAPDVTAHGEELKPPPGQVGHGDEYGGTEVWRSDNARLTLELKGEHSEFADGCPDRFGQVAGTASFGAGQSGDLSGTGHSLGYNASVTARASFHAQVGDDGRVADYDMEYVGMVSGGGTLPGFLGIAHTSHAEAEVTMYFPHLRVGEDLPDNLRRDVREIQLSGFTVGQFIDGSAVAAMNQAASLVRVLKGEADEALTTAQENWYDKAACLGAEFDPPYLNDIAPNSTHPISIAVHATRDGAVPVSMPLTLAPSQGSVDPSSATYDGSPMQVSWTVGDTRAPEMLAVSGVSKRGRLQASMTAFIAPSYTVVYAPSSTADASYGYNESSGPSVDMGTYSEQRDLAMTATVATTSPGPGQSATGSGPLTWQSPSWTTDDLNTGSAQGLGQTCTIDYKTTYTAFTPGTLQVKSLMVGTPGPGGVPSIQLDVVVNGVGEHYQLDETPVSGPCPGFPNDGDTHLFESELTQMHQAVGDPITPAGQGFELQLNTGWKPGTGDVIATRTVSWSHGGDRPGGPANAVQDSDTFQIIRTS
jgi:hypothetical protein